MIWHNCFRFSTSEAKNKVQVLHISAPHAAESLVATTASQLIKDFSFQYDLIERNLWKEVDRLEYTRSYTICQ